MNPAVDVQKPQPVQFVMTCLIQTESRCAHHQVMKVKITGYSTWAFCVCGEFQTNKPRLKHLVINTNPAPKKHKHQKQPQSTSFYKCCYTVILLVLKVLENFNDPILISASELPRGYPRKGGAVQTLTNAVMLLFGPPAMFQLFEQKTRYYCRKKTTQSPCDSYIFEVGISQVICQLRSCQGDPDR